MKRLIPRRSFAVLRIVLIALIVPATLEAIEDNAQANPITCCNLDLDGVANSTHLKLMMRLRKSCIGKDPCPSGDRVLIWRNGELLSLIWTLEEKATTCNYTAHDELIALKNKYHLEMKGVKDCLTGTSTTRSVDAGLPDLSTAKDAAQDGAHHADATHLPPSGGDKGCAVGGSGPLLPLGAVLPLSLLALGVFFRRRRR